jgi:hypothetical protein
MLTKIIIKTERSYDSNKNVKSKDIFLRLFGYTEDPLT